MEPHCPIGSPRNLTGDTRELMRDAVERMRELFGKEQANRLLTVMKREGLIKSDTMGDLVDGIVEPIRARLDVIERARRCQEMDGCRRTARGFCRRNARIQLRPTGGA